MKYRAVLFDLDGTLIDSLFDIGLAANRTLKRFGLPEMDIHEYRYLVGRGAEYLVRNCLPESDLNDGFVQEFLTTFLDDYNENYDKETRLYPGVPELLDELTQREIKMVILSNKRDETTKSCVQKFLANWSFEKIWGSRMKYPKKPDPTAALVLADELSIQPEAFLYLGDTEIDMHTAVSSRMKPIGVAWGFRPVDNLIKSGAERVIQHPLELISEL